MTQFIESDDALGCVFVLFFKNSRLQVKINLLESPLRPRDVRPGMEPYSSLASKLVDSHIAKR